MGWILFGFLAALGIETCIRVSHDYEQGSKREVTRTQFSLPWYGWGLLGLGILGIWRKGKRK